MITLIGVRQGRVLAEAHLVGRLAPTASDISSC